MSSYAARACARVITVSLSLVMKPYHAYTRCTSGAGYLIPSVSAPDDVQHVREALHLHLLVPILALVPQCTRTRCPTCARSRVPAPVARRTHSALALPHSDSPPDV